MYTKNDWVRFNVGHYPLHYNRTYIWFKRILFMYKVHRKRIKCGLVRSYPLHYNLTLGLNVFYSCMKCTENDWVRLKVRHYPLQSSLTLALVLSRCPGCDRGVPGRTGDTGRLERQRVVGIDEAGLARGSRHANLFSRTADDYKI